MCVAWDYEFVGEGWWGRGGRTLGDETRDDLVLHHAVASFSPLLSNPPNTLPFQPQFPDLPHRLRLLVFLPTPSASPLISSSVLRHNITWPALTWLSNPSPRRPAATATPRPPSFHLTARPPRLLPPPPPRLSAVRLPRMRATRVRAAHRRVPCLTLRARPLQARAAAGTHPPRPLRFHCSLKFPPSRAVPYARRTCRVRRKVSAILQPPTSRRTSSHAHLSPCVMAMLRPPSRPHRNATKNAKATRARRASGSA